MWDFLSKFIFIASASIALGQQSVIVTFGSGNSNDNTREGDTYNLISHKNDNSFHSFGLNTNPPTSPLKCTDGSTSPITFSVENLYASTGLIQEFSGTEESIALINETFGNAEIRGYTNSSQNVIFTLANLKAGSYTLSVLVARGTPPSAPISANTYSLLNGKQALQNVTATIIASSVSDSSRQQTVTNDGTAVSAYTVGASKTATDWALIEFSFELTNELNTIKLRSSSTCGNVAAIKLTSIPEPCSSVLFTIALTSFAQMRRRRK